MDYLWSPLNEKVNANNEQNECFQIRKFPFAVRASCYLPVFVL